MSTAPGIVVCLYAADIRRLPKTLTDGRRDYDLTSNKHMNWRKRYSYQLIKVNGLQL
jgi:hypothetical protein